MSITRKELVKALRVLAQDTETNDECKVITKEDTYVWLAANMLEADGKNQVEREPAKGIAQHFTPSKKEPQTATRERSKFASLPKTATRGQLVTRGIKAAGGYPAPKGFRVVGYDWGRQPDGPRAGFVIRAQVSRTYAHHMTGRVYNRVIAKGHTFEAALEAAIARCKKAKEFKFPSEKTQRRKGFTM